MILLSVLKRFDVNRIRSLEHIAIDLNFIQSYKRVSYDISGELWIFSRSKIYSLFRISFAHKICATLKKRFHKKSISVGVNHLDRAIVFIILIGRKMQSNFAVVLIAVCVISGANGRVINDNRKKPAEAAYGYNTMFGDQDETGKIIIDLFSHLII